MLCEFLVIHRCECLLPDEVDCFVEYTKRRREMLPPQDWRIEAVLA